MILYKYIDYKGGLKILKNNTLGFRPPEHFNDPHELTTGFPTEEFNAKKPFKDSHMEVNSAEELTALYLKNFFLTIMSKKIYAVASLTRNQFNPTMWSHYADGHKGFVIGYNVNLKELTNEKLNLIPVQYGNVIYTHTKPEHKYFTKWEPSLFLNKFEPKILEALQRIFLYKSTCWSYEEEVRIVKTTEPMEINQPGPITLENLNVKTNSDLQQVNNVNGVPLFLLKLPPDTIQKVYCGYRNPVLDTSQFSKKINQLRRIIAKNSPNAKLYRCMPDSGTWNFEPAELPE